MLRLSRLALLSALWRPHSEQIKFWIASSAADTGALSLARSYLHDLDLENVVVTLDDAVELLDILQKIKYPLGSHVTSHLAKHFEATGSELSAKNLKQLIADARLADGDLYYYEATLGSSSFFAALTRCVRTFESNDLVQLVLPFSSFASRNEPQSAQVALRISQIVAGELSVRLRASNDKPATLIFIAAQSLPLEKTEWEELRQAVFAHTVNLDALNLQSLLQSITAHSSPNLNSAWGAVVQETLVQSGKVASTDVSCVVLNVVRAGCCVHDALANQWLARIDLFSAEQVFSIVAAWQEVKLGSSICEPFTPSVQNRLVAYLEVRTQQLQARTLSIDNLMWLYGLSFLSPDKGAEQLKLLSVDIEKQPHRLSGRGAALLSGIMINTNHFTPVLVHSISLHVESGALDQEESIAVLHVYQRSGKVATQKLVRKAAGRLSRRLMATRFQETNANGALSLYNLAVLLAGLSFVDDGEQLALLRRLLLLEQVTPAVAMTVLRYTHRAKTKACQLMRTRFVKKLIEAAHTLNNEELSFTMSIMAELKIRDAAAFEHLLRELAKRSVSVKDVVAAGLAAKTLKLNSAFEQLAVLQSVHKLPDITPADVLTVLRCCGTERRRALLVVKEVSEIVDSVPIANTTTVDLVLLFVISAANKERKDLIERALAAREPVPRHEVVADDVVSAFECATSVRQVESICKVCANAAHDFDELHLMRLLRCAQGYSAIPNRFYRFVGTAILLLSSRERLSPNNALLWIKFYVDHQVRDDAVGRGLVGRASRLLSSASPELRRSFQKAKKMYGGKVRHQRTLLTP